MTQEWIKRDGKILLVETETIVNERILAEYTVEDYDKMIADQEKAITEFDQKKHIAELQKGVDYLKEVKLTAKSATKEIK